MPNCVTIAEPTFDRKKQKFNITRSARQDSRLGCRQIPAQAFNDQSIDLRKELLRHSDVLLAFRIDRLRELDTLDSRVAITPTVPPRQTLTVVHVTMWRSSTACGYIQEIWLTSATQSRSFAGASYL
jgi:hypothetical protein